MILSQSTWIIIVVILIAIAIYLYMKMNAATLSHNVAHQKANEYQQSLILNQEINAKKDNLINELKIDIATLEQRYADAQLRWEQHQKDSERMEKQFELLAHKVLDHKSAQIDNHQQEQMKLLLDPLKERIKLFESRIDQNTKDDIERHATLREQIKSLAILNERMTTETANLTKALKGDNKTQGNWGELILEQIMERSGLRKGEEYFVQESHTDANGKRLQPDMLIKTPDHKVYVIDAKVSLTAYEQYVNAEDENTGNAALKAHILSLRQHVDILAKKNYHSIYDMDSPELVLMFMPIETAFAVAVNTEAQLYQYAFDRHVVIVTPSTLLATLKTIDSLWRNDRQQKNAIAIAAEAGKMYDKFQAFTDDMAALEQRIQQLNNSYDSAMNKLSTGKGNLIRRAEKIRELGAKAQKKIDQKIVKRDEE